MFGFSFYCLHYVAVIALSHHVSAVMCFVHIIIIIIIFHIFWTYMRTIFNI